MNRLKTIVLFAGIFGIGLGALSLSGVSAPLMVSAAPHADGVGMLGHVEYKLMDEFGQIKQYLQADNVVVGTGQDCVARMLFENSTAGVCPQGFNEFNYIAIGNYSAAQAVNATMTELDTTSAGNCASTTVDGEMARKQITLADNDFTAAVTAVGSEVGAIVVLDTSTDPFDFGISNSTGNIFQSGIFDASTSLDGDGQCTGALSTSTMFSVQDLNSETGISVSSGDSLSVKWTITVG